VRVSNAFAVGIADAGVSTDANASVRRCGACVDAAELRNTVLAVAISVNVTGIADAQLLPAVVGGEIACGFEAIRI
jgi:hypothetical protein